MVLGWNYQLCLGQKCGMEYTIHTLRKQYEKTYSDAILLIDAENAFNSELGKYMPFYTELIL